MAVSTDQYERLLNYLDGQLSPAEEESFVQELSANTELQKEFDFELLLRAGADDEAAGTELPPELEPASVHVQKARAVLANEPLPAELPPTEKARVVQMKPSYRRAIAVAASLLAIAALAAFFLTGKKDEPIAGGTPPVKTEGPIQKSDSPVKEKVRPNPQEKIENPAMASAGDNENVYAKVYSRYEATDEDPRLVRDLLNAYRSKNFSRVLSATEDEYAVLGAEDELPGLYVRFYKALSLLETNKPEQAIAAFKRLEPKSQSSPQLSAAVRWYLGMAYLKGNNMMAARNVFASIAAANGSSPYQSKAADLLKALK